MAKRELIEQDGTPVVPNDDFSAVAAEMAESIIRTPPVGKTVLPLSPFQKSVVSSARCDVKIIGDRGGNLEIEFWLDRSDETSAEIQAVRLLQGMWAYGDLAFRFQGANKVFTVCVPFNVAELVKLPEGMREKILAAVKARRR